MLKALYTIGLSMKEQDENWPPDMYNERKIRWEVQLTSEGRLQSVTSIDPRKKSLGRIQAPAVIRTNNVKPCLVVDKSDYVLGVDKGKDNKHGAYLGLLKKCIDETANHDLAVIYNYLSDSLDELKSELEDQGLDPKASWINISVDGRYPINCPSVQAWWAEYSRDELELNEVCSISGQYGPITRLFPVSIQFYNEAKKEEKKEEITCKPASVDSPAHRSYGYDKADHAPISHDAALISGTALKLLCANPQSSKHLGGAHFAFWTRDSTFRDGLLALGFGGNDQAHTSEIRVFFDGVFKGKIHYPRLDKFYMVTITNTKSRLVARRVIESTLGDVVENVHRWFQSLDIVGSIRGRMTLKDISRSLCISNKRQDNNLQLALVKHAFFGEYFDRSFYALVFPRINASLYDHNKSPEWRSPTHEQVAIIKMYLSQVYPEVKDLVFLEENLKYIAYQYGRLMAAYEAIQLDASPNIQRTVTERFFSAMMINPVRSIAKLDALARTHLRKGARDRGKGWHVHHSRRLQDINQKISEQEAAHCNDLTLEERGLFVLGYWHEKNNTYKRNKETLDETGPEQDQ